MEKFILTAYLKEIVIANNEVKKEDRANTVVSFKLIYPRPNKSDIDSTRIIGLEDGKPYRPDQAIDGLGESLGLLFKEEVDFPFALQVQVASSRTKRKGYLKMKSLLKNASSKALGGFKHWTLAGSETLGGVSEKSLAALIENSDENEEIGVVAQGSMLLNKTKNEEVTLELFYSMDFLDGQDTRKPNGHAIINLNFDKVSE